MEQKGFVAACDDRLKLVRTEFGLTQAKMADVLGISKKSLVETEKHRRSLGWTASVTLCTIFCNSEILTAAFGGNPTELIAAIAFEGDEPVHPQTMGGKIWWTTIEENSDYVIQQNIVSQHYRLLTHDDCRIMSSFDLNDILPIFNAKRSA